MKRIMLVVAYDGTEYSGFAAQKDASIRTIEGELNRALSELTGEEIHVAGASRTDAGVHALCNYVVFDTASPIPPAKFSMAVNTHLPEDIRVRKSKEVDFDFHPRAQLSEKTYEYRIYNAQIPDPLKQRYAYCTYFHLDTDRMRRAAAFLVGEHDFASFSNPARDTKNTVREITKIEIEERRCGVPQLMLSRQHTIAQEDEARDIVIRVCGRGFLYNMVRIIAGTLIRVGRGMTQPEEIPDILAALDRQVAGDTAPARGLWLVDYRILGKKKLESTKKTALIFDMDGTLWDSSENVAASWTEEIHRHAKLLGSDSRRLITGEDVRSVMGMTMTAIADTFYPELSEGDKMQLLKACCQYENEYLGQHGGELYPELEQTLRRLQEKGYPLYIVSNCQKGYIETFLDYYGFRKYFLDIECFGNNGKGKAENIRELAERNHLADNYYYVGDIQADYDAATAAGGRFIHAAYGFGTIEQTVPELRKIRDLPEMMELLAEEK